MAISQEQNEIIKEYRVHETDTGSPEYKSLYLLRNQRSKRTLTYTQKDHHSRRGLLKW